MVASIASGAPVTATVAVSTATPPKPYSPMLFGGFLEHFGKQIYGGVFDPGSALADDQGFRLDVIEALRHLKSTVVRWPGGCYASGYHWKDGVGERRRPTDDMAWGVVEPNTFGTDEFVELCRRLDWQPYICNSAGNGAIEEMRDWVEYCNGTAGPYARQRVANGFVAPRNVRIWSIGNENWGLHEIGHKPIEAWAPFVRKAAQAMKQADPTITLTAAAVPTAAWLVPLLEQAGEYLDFISIHGYWLGLWQENAMPDYLTCVMQSTGPEAASTACIQHIDRAGWRGRIKIAFDEWNLRGWHHPGFPRRSIQDYDDPEVQHLVARRDDNLIASQYTMADALFSASFLNACLRHSDDVTMANIAPLVNTRGPLYAHPQGIVKRTHYHTMAMYANELEARVGTVKVEAESLTQGEDSVPVVDAIATVDESGERWAIALVNRHPSQSVICALKVGGRLLDGSYRATILTADSPDAYNDIEHPDRVAPTEVELVVDKGNTTLRPHSLTIAHVTIA